MGVFSLVAALLLEQLHSLGKRNPFYLGFHHYAAFIERSSNAGQYRHGVVGWCAAVLPIAVLAGAVAWGLNAVHPLLMWLWNVAVLYLTVGFRQFSSAFTGISEALRDGNLDEARRLLAEWTSQPTSELTEAEVSRLSIEHGLTDSYRYVFGPIFWFMLLGPFGAAGAVAYRASSLLAQEWGLRALRHDEPFGLFASKVGAWLDWLPVRLTAIGFAVMGDFEDAVYCWRSQAHAWANYDYGILLASGAGAIGVKLGEAIHQDHTVKFRPELGLGEDADPNYLQSAVGLIWRSALLWLAVLLLLGLARLV
ncbi:CobD/CbiB family protein [Parachitinimonas caeni]|uniref:Cobalamin biosynthesis protein CobD n=1 Tax=Parachitinimonas caeni TaxID=3031301 RepID=A0ABT7DWW9_9NEIS|nr:CobD/CbiB family protein [Parachitinimonas caeni]MDK2123578.1 CobD/CbiB family protein [Parachitinimonas caeni]